MSTLDERLKLVKHIASAAHNSDPYSAANWIKAHEETEHQALKEQNAELLAIAKLWLEHCVEEIRYFQREGDQDNEIEWLEKANNAILAIANATGKTPK